MQHKISSIDFIRKLNQTGTPTEISDKIVTDKLVINTKLPSTGLKVKKM